MSHIIRCALSKVLSQHITRCLSWWTILNFFFFSVLPLIKIHVPTYALSSFYLFFLSESFYHYSLYSFFISMCIFKQNICVSYIIITVKLILKILEPMIMLKTPIIREEMSNKLIIFYLYSVHPFPSDFHYPNELLIHLLLQAQWVNKALRL